MGKKKKKKKKAKKKAKKLAKKLAKRRARKASRAARPARKKRRQPESLRLRSTTPSLTVNDLPKSLGFYRDVLGFTEGERWEHGGVLQGVELVAGGVSFMLSQDDWKKGRDRVKGQGFRIYCSTAQDVDALAKRIKARGGTLAEEPKDQPWGTRDFAVTDPDGFTITIASEG
jgi:lactoylglutathione lyase